MGKKIPKKPGNVKPKIDWWSPAITLAVVVAVLSAIVAHNFYAIVPYEGKSYLGYGRPMILAHRGSRILGPESTLIAFSTAKSLGADVIELDLRLSADNRVVVMHDPTLERTTNCFGLVRNTTLDQLKKCDAGYQYTLDGETFPFRDSGIQIPTFVQVLDAMGPDMFLNVEIKDEHPPDAFRCYDFAAKMLKKRKMEGNVVWASRFQLTLDYIRFKNKDAPQAASEKAGYKAILLHAAKLDWLFPPVADVLQVPVKSGGVVIGTSEFTKGVQLYGRKVYYWTVNDPQQMLELIKMGADGFITDRTDLAVKIFSDMGLMEPVEDIESLIPEPIRAQLGSGLYSHFETSGSHVCATKMCRVMTLSPAIPLIIAYGAYALLLAAGIAAFYFSFFWQYRNMPKQPMI